MQRLDVLWGLSSGLVPSQAAAMGLKASMMVSAGRGVAPPYCRSIACYLESSSIYCLCSWH